jgi:hypothetical protein
MHVLLRMYFVGGVVVGTSKQIEAWHGTARHDRWESE